MNLLHDGSAYSKYGIVHEVLNQPNNNSWSQTKNEDENIHTEIKTEETYWRNRLHL